MAVTTPASPRVATRVDVSAARVVRTPRSGAALVVALVAVCAYAVFAHGAVGLPEEPRLQIGIALVAIGAAVGWLFSRTLRLSAPAEAWIGVGLLLAFAVWCGITLLWSVAPERTWAYVNRGIAYTLVVVLAIAVASSVPRAIERMATGWLLVAIACALYAIAGKVIPGVEILGISFNHTEVASRLRAPLEYWNALGLVVVLAVPIALRLTTDAARRPVVRFAAIAALWLLLVCLGMTYSRGAILAVLVVLAIATMLGGARLRGLGVFGVSLILTIPALGLSFSRPALKGINVPLDQRIPDGIILGIVMAGSLITLFVAAWGLLRFEQRSQFDDERRRLVWRGLAATAAVLGALLLLAVVTADGGPRGVADRAWEKFSKVSQDKVSDPARIVSSNSGNRWVWWKEAAGAWWDKPIQGWGAGSFAVTHKLYRKVELGVVQPHNMPLQYLAETGVIGALIVLGGLGFLFFGALDRVRAMMPGRERDIAVALFAGAGGWLVHGLVDWDWDIPGVTVPALLFLGVLVARPLRAAGGLGLTRDVPADGADGARGVALAFVCVLMGLVIVSAALPMIADSKASAAQAVSTTAGDDELEHAAAQAELASRLDPTAVRPLLAAAAIAQGRGRLLDARRYLLRAVDRQPYSAIAWERLLRLALTMVDRPGAKAAVDRLLELDPVGSGARALAGRLVLFSAPAASSPTATGTPLRPLYQGAPAFVPAPVPGAAGTPPGVGTATTPAPGTTTTPGTASGAFPAGPSSAATGGRPSD
ncbi:MAG TPA: O-antigen ligase family protein [Solirubrobacteraceae bacterium]